jgi:hypothetical protein
LAVSAGDAYLDIGPRLAGNFGRQLSSQVQAPIGKAGEEASKHFGRSFAHGVGTAAKGIGIGIAAGLGLAAIAVRALTPVLKQSVQGYRDHLKVVAQTTAVIRSTGGAAKVTVKHITALSDALERKTTVDGDVIQTGANMIATFTNVRNEVGKGNNIFDRATSTVLDMSVALGQDTKNSAIQLGKALNDPIKGVGALSRVGVTFTKQQKDQIKTLVDSGHTLEAQKIILAELNKEFGGSAAAQATASGRMQVAWHQLQDTIGSVLLPVVDRFENSLGKKVIPDLNVLATKYGPAVQATLLRWVDSFTKLLPSTKELGFGLTALGAAFSGEGITTSADSFVGKMERLGVTGRKIVDWAKGLGPQLAGIGQSLGKVFQGASQAGPALQQAGGGGHVFANSLIIIGPVLDVVARNLHNIIPWLPAIVAGFLAFRAIRSVTGPLVQVGELISNITAPFRIAALFGQKRALQAHTTALMENTAAMRGNAVSTELSTAAGNAGIIAAVRARAAMVGQAIAAKAVAVASRAWAAVQWLVNAALTANPIGLIIVGIAALAAGIIYAYKHSETFRKIVDGAFRAIRGAVGTAVNFIIGLFRAWFDTSSMVVLGILHMFGKLPGPMGAPFRAAETAVKNAKKTVDTQLDKIQGRVNKLTGKDIPVTASLKLNFSPTYTAAQWAADRQRAGRMAGGGMLRGPGTGTSDSIPLWGSKGEFMVNSRSTSKWLPVLRFINADHKAAGGPVGQIGTQTGTVNKIEARGTGVRLHAALAKFIAKFGGGDIKAFLRMADALPYIWGGVGPGGYDCSGITGEVLNRMQHRPSYHRRFTTASNFGALGFKPGPGGVYTIGVNAAGGHMAGRYGGLAFEAANTRAGIRIGSAARSVATFPAQYHMAKGGLVEWLARQPGIAIGGDPSHLRIESYDRGGFLPSGHLALNTTGRPEALGFDYDKLGRAVADALRANPPRVAVDEIVAASARLDRRVGGVPRR